MQTVGRKALGDNAVNGCPEVCVVHNHVVLMICNSATKLRVSEGNDACIVCRA